MKPHLPLRQFCSTIKQTFFAPVAGSIRVLFIDDVSFSQQSSVLSLCYTSALIKKLQKRQKICISSDRRGFDKSLLIRLYDPKKPKVAIIHTNKRDVNKWHDFIDFDLNKIELGIDLHFYKE